jgi:hypothetical protein
MRSNDTEAPHGTIRELREALDAIPADEPRNYLVWSKNLNALFSQRLRVYHHPVLILHSTVVYLILTPMSGNGWGGMTHELEATAGVNHRLCR